MKTKFIFGMLLLAGLVSIQAAKRNQSPTGTLYDGRTFGVVGELGNHRVVACATRDLPQSGGFFREGPHPLNVQNVIRADSCLSEISGLSGLVFSENIITDLVFRYRNNTITAQRMRTWSLTGCCHTNVATLGGKAEFTGLVVNGVPVETGPANQVVPLRGGQLIVNEHDAYLGVSDASLTVNGLHITLSDGTDLVIGQANVAVDCTHHVDHPPEEHDKECDFVTGGGFIITPDGDHGSFGVQGGLRNGRLWGGLNYVDHSTGMHVRGRRVLSYEVVDADTRRITYQVLIDRTRGTAVVEVSDYGEPGRLDEFFIRLDNGYSAGGDVGGARPGAGNIHLHTCGNSADHSH